MPKSGERSSMIYSLGCLDVQERKVLLSPRWLPCLEGVGWRSGELLTQWIGFKEDL